MSAALLTCFQQVRMPSLRLFEISLIDGWLQANVFARRHQDRRIVFENQAVRRYAQDLDLRTVASRLESTTVPSNAGA